MCVVSVGSSVCGEGGEVLFFFSQLKPFLTPIARVERGRGGGGVGGKLQVCTQVNGSYFGYKKTAHDLSQS